MNITDCRILDIFEEIEAADNMEDIKDDTMEDDVIDYFYHLYGDNFYEDDCYFSYED